MERFRMGPVDRPPAPRRGGMAPAALGMLALLGGCGSVGNPFRTPADAYMDAGGLFGPAWGGDRPEILTASTTVARLRGMVTPAETLQPEPGDVWPGPPPPRTTLANPDAALRGVPDYQPAGARSFPDSSLRDLPPPQPLGRPDLSDGAADPRPPGRAQRAGPPSGLPGQLRGSSSPPPPPLAQPELPPGQAALPPPAQLPRPPARADGRVIQTPGGPVVTSGGTDRVQSFTVPGGGTGTAVRDGSNTVLFGPDGRVQTVPTPR